MFKGFKAVGVMYGVVACKDNDKVGGCSSGVTGVVGCDDRLVVFVVG